MSLLSFTKIDKFAGALKYTSCCAPKEPFKDLRKGESTLLFDFGFIILIASLKKNTQIVKKVKTL